MATMLKALLLLAILMLPMGMAPAFAQPASHAATMPMRHCPEQGSSHHAKGAFAECTMACSAALPAVDGMQPRPVPRDRALASSIAVRALNGLHPDTATPPPKRA